MPKYPKPADFKPVQGWPESHKWHSDKKRRRCQGWNRNEGHQCDANCIKGRDYCRVHGGKYKRGVEHGMYKHGGYSKDLPERLARDYKRFEQSERLSIDPELHLLRAIYTSYVQALGEEGSIPLWREANRAYAEFLVASEAGDTELATKLLSEVGEILGKGATGEQQENKLFAKVQIIDKLMNTQARLDETKGRLIAIDSVMLLIGGIIATVKDSVAGLDEGKTILENVLRISRKTLGEVDRNAVISRTD